MSSSDISTTRPRVLFVYYTYTQQKPQGGRGDVRGAPRARLRRYTGRDRVHRQALGGPIHAVSRCRHAILDILGMLPAQLRGATGEIQIPPGSAGGDYDLVCHRLAHVVVAAERAGPFVPEVRLGGAGGRREGFAAFVVCRRYWRNNLKAVQEPLRASRAASTSTRSISPSRRSDAIALSLISYFGKPERTRSATSG